MFFLLCGMHVLVFPPNCKPEGFLSHEWSIVKLQTKKTKNIQKRKKQRIVCECGWDMGGDLLGKGRYFPFFMLTTKRPFWWGKTQLHLLSKKFLPSLFIPHTEDHHAVSSTLHSYGNRSLLGKSWTRAFIWLLLFVFVFCPLCPSNNDVPS